MINIINGGVTAPLGFSAAGVHCGIRKNKDKLDLALIVSDVLCNAAAVYTQNLVKGAPIVVTQKNIKNGKAKAVICNSGNANTCNADGEEKALKMCEIAADIAGCEPCDIIVASTGVIGQILPIEPILNAKNALKKAMSKKSDSVANAILTTDTHKKEYATEFILDGKTCTIGGIAKGSGMINPNMATMLSFLTTDTAISSEMLYCALKEVCDDTFNMISIDGDTSTNDMVSIMASGLAGNNEIVCKDENYNIFKAALLEVCTHLSMEIAKDGEGATKLLVCEVNGAKSPVDARLVAKSVINSSLFKAAMFGCDANWGRILCAVGYAGADADVNKIGVKISSKNSEIVVCENGYGVDFCEEAALALLKNDEVKIIILLNDGDFSATAYGCDLTYDYVKINGDYRT